MTTLHGAVLQGPGLQTACARRQRASVEVRKLVPFVDCGVDILIVAARVSADRGQEATGYRNGDAELGEVNHPELVRMERDSDMSKCYGSSTGNSI